MRAARYWAVRHARALEWIYLRFEPLLFRLAPLLQHKRLERPITAVERTLKGFLFDCQMCGHCVLSDTGMACPMNCPKQLRNGPCGGVRANGHCEVDPSMRCVWVEAHQGSQRMRHGNRIRMLQLPVDASAQGQSSWLAVIRNKKKTAVESVHEV